MNRGSAEDKQRAEASLLPAEGAAVLARATLEEVAGFGVARLEELDRADGFASVVDDAAAVDWGEVRKLFLPRETRTTVACDGPTAGTRG